MKRRLSPHLATALPADMFTYSQLPNETRISAAEYRKLVEAARAKSKMPALLAWQKNRKIILTD